MPQGRATGLCDTPEEAEALRLAFVAERAAMFARGELDPVEEQKPARETLASWGRTWLQRRETRVRWFANDKSRWRLYVEKSALATMPLVEVRAKHVKAWLADLLATKRGGELLTARTVRHVFNLVRKALADAVDEETIAVNPAAGVKIPKRPGAVTSAPREYLTADEIRAVLSCEAIPEASRLLYAVAVHTGMREGELIGLRFGDVRESAQRPEVIVRWSHGDAPKNGKVESVPLLPQARAAFARLRELACDEDGDGPKDDVLVFPSPRGYQRQPSDDFGWSSRKVRGKPRVGHREVAGVNRAVTFHGLRHTCGSHLLMGTFGVTLTLAEVRVWLRHEDVETTDVYAHIAPGTLHERIANMAAAGVGKPASASGRVTTTEPATAPSRALPEPPGGADAAVTRSGHATRSNMGHANLPALTETPVFPTARDTRVELVTLGFGDPGSTLENKGESRVCDPCVTHARGATALRDAALGLLRAVDEGLPAGPLARDLAVEALRQTPADSSLWTLAVNVLDGGALKTRRAVELAGQVLDAVVAAEDVSFSSMPPRARETKG